MAILTSSSSVKTHVLLARLESGVMKGQRIAANAPAGGTVQAIPRRTNVKGPVTRAITAVLDRLIQRAKGYAPLVSGVGRELMCALIVIPATMAKPTRKEETLRRALMSVNQDISRRRVLRLVKYALEVNTQTPRVWGIANHALCNRNPQFLSLELPASLSWSVSAVPVPLVTRVVLVEKKTTNALPVHQEHLQALLARRVV